jgi:SWI/SNF-related matrix-associated actin-dependent regulator of chromatin subfamily A protein 2/4
VQDFLIMETSICVQEQAVARAHRIGQTKEVRVLYMEAVADGIPFYEMEDKLAERAQREVQRDESDDEDERPKYVGSIETLVRSQIQQHKIDMADEVGWKY